MRLTLRPVLSPQEIEQIHEHSLDLLERVGIDYKTPQALSYLEQYDCPVNYKRTWASIPRQLVEWALEQAPNVVKLSARDPQHDVLLDGERPHHTTDSQGTQVIDLESGELHDSSAKDLARGLLFADALDMIEIVNVMISASDVPAHLRTLNHFALAFTQTSKHVRSGVLNASQVPLIIEMVEAVTEHNSFRPIFSVVDCTVSPLMHDGQMTEACIELAKLSVPILIYPMPLAGGTSPVTISGTILLHNIEFLSGLVLFQAVNPGTPIIYGTGASQLDMHTGRYGGSADGHGLRLGLCDLAHFYDLPVNMWGMSTSSKSLDAQYGSEAIIHSLLGYLAGADELYSIGLLGDAQILSLEKMVLDNHLTRQLEVITKPILVDEAHLQADLIEQAGIGGHFLKLRQTRDFTRQEYTPKWPPAGKTMLELVHEEALDILHSHKPPPLPEGATAKIETILANADKKLSIK